jgi:hypothetical protein
MVNYSAYVDRDRDELPLDFPSDNSLVCSDILDTLAHVFVLSVRFISMIFISWFCELTSQPGWERLRRECTPSLPESPGSDWQNCSAIPPHGLRKGSTGFKVGVLKNSE